MKKGQAFIVVGHRHWGKSTTLRELASGKLSVVLSAYKLFIKRMSNDDPPVSRLLKFILKQIRLSRRYLIIALCPDFDTENTITTVLDTLKDYDLNFWVIKHSQDPNRPAREITDQELKALRQHGKVEVFPRKEATAKQIADKFRAFIEESLSKPK